MNTKTSTIFHKLGISQIEENIYTTLLKKGPLSITQISKIISTPRTTTHENTERLIQKGLITKTIKGVQKKLIAENPSKLKILVAEKKVEIINQQQNIKDIENHLPSVISSLISNKTKTEDNNNLDIKIYEGENDFKTIFNRSLEKAEGEILMISNLNEFYKIYSQKYDKNYYIPERLKNKIFLKLLTFQSPTTNKLKDEDKKFYRETRFLPRNIIFNSTTLIYNNEVSIMVSATPYRTILINNQELWNTHKYYFEQLWKISKNLS